MKKQMGIRQLAYYSPKYVSDLSENLSPLGIPLVRESAINVEDDFTKRYLRSAHDQQTADVPIDTQTISTDTRRQAQIICQCYG